MPFHRKAVAAVAIALAVGSAPVANADTAHGIHAFTADGTFAVPDGVTSVFLALWGAGGGGGAANGPQIGGNGGAGGGGGGAWCAVPVNPETEYVVTVGVGGAAGISGQHDGNGASGTDSSLALSGSPALAVAHGGQSGFGATTDGRNGSAGRGGTGECRDASGVTAVGEGGNGDHGGAVGVLPTAPPSGIGAGGDAAHAGSGGYLLLWW
jgi:MSHA biogenesis protein MshQ